MKKRPTNHRNYLADLEKRLLEAESLFEQSLMEPSPPANETITRPQSSDFSSDCRPLSRNAYLISETDIDELLPTNAFASPNDLTFSFCPTETVVPRLDLLNLFFSHCYTVFPIVPQDVFYKNTALVPDLTLLAMCAYGAMYLPGISSSLDISPIERGIPYVNKALKILDATLNGSSVFHVYGLIILGTYCISCGKCMSHCVAC
jgi:hypothetical protein